MCLEQSERGGQREEGSHGAGGGIYDCVECCRLFFGLGVEP